MAQPKYDSNTGMPVYSVQTDQPAYLCADIEWTCATCTETMQAVFSGFTAPCFCNTITQKKVTAISGLNATHTLTRDGSDDCLWKLTGVGSATVTSYSDASCTNSTGSVNTTMLIQLRYSGGSWRVFVDTEDASREKIYEGLYIITDTCPNAWTMSNTFICNIANVCTIDEI